MWYLRFNFGALMQSSHSISGRCDKLKHTGRMHISKTSSVPNSDAISRKQYPNIAVPERGSPEPNQYNKWVRLNRHNNNRALSTIQTQIHPPLSSYNLVSKDESREFMAVFPDIVRSLTDAGRQTDIPEVTKRFAKVLHYNVPNGKKNRGLAVVAAYKMLEDPDRLTEESIRLANIMGWCVELLQAFFIVDDDIIDRSQMRRGMPCWYTKEDVGLMAINDALLLKQSIFTLLKRYFAQHQCYLPAIELFNDVCQKTIMGQMLDCMCTMNGRPNLDMFTMNKYNAIVKYKTAYYTFQLPMALAMCMADMYDTETHRQAKTILMEMGLFFQIQDDFLDCFGDPEKTGKKGNDIREGKCSWLAVVALQRANARQRQIMDQYYGRDDDTSIQTIKSLYEELGLPSTYAIYEEESFNIIRTHVHQISKGLPHKLFFKIMEKLYKRDC